MKPASLQRHYGMDWLRIGAFMLLILYHVGYNFTPWGYQTPTRGVVGWAEIPLLALSPWRLSLLFAISGYASAALLAKDGSTGEFFRNRLARLGIPLAFGLLVIVPPQPYMGLVNSGYEHGYLYYLLHDAFTFRTVRLEYVPRAMHMWFVIYLLAYTVLFCAVRAAMPQSWREALHAKAERALASPALLPLGIGAVFLVRQFVPYGWTDLHSILDDRAAHLHYGAMFLFGLLLRESEALRLVIASQWKQALALALAGFAWAAGDAWVFPGNTPTPAAWSVPLCLAKSLMSWCTVIALFGVADRYWNRDASWRATLAEAVFPVYIAHQTIMVLVSYWLRDKGLAALPEFLLLCSSVAIGSWFFYLVGREIGPLRPLIGLKRQRPAKRRPQQAPVLASSPA